MRVQLRLHAAGLPGSPSTQHCTRAPAACTDAQIGMISKLLQNVNLAGTSLFLQILGVSGRRQQHHAAQQVLLSCRSSCWQRRRLRARAACTHAGTLA